MGDEIGDFEFVAGDGYDAATVSVGHKLKTKQPSQGKEDKKRKRDDETVEDETSAKKQKLKDRRAQQKERQKLKFEEMRQDRQVEDKAPEAQAQFLWRLYLQKYQSDDVIPLEGHHILSLGDGVKHEDTKYGEELKKLLGKDWKNALTSKTKRPNGAPSVLIISESGERACEVFKQLREFHHSVPVMKLFSKHIKVEDQQKALTSSVCCIGVGTPNRLHKLAQMGCLNLDECKLFVIDMHRDIKGMSLMDHKQIQEDFLLFYRTFVHGIVTEEKANLCFL